MASYLKFFQTQTFVNNEELTDGSKLLLRYMCDYRLY